VLGAGDSALRVDLSCELYLEETAYHLAVQLVVLLEDAVDRLDVLEGKEGETARAAGRVAHDGALINVTVLAKVRPQAVLELLVLSSYKVGWQWYWLCWKSTVVTLATCQHSTTATVRPVTCALLTVRRLPVEAADEHLAV